MGIYQGVLSFFVGCVVTDPHKEFLFCVKNEDILQGKIITTMRSARNEFIKIKLMFLINMNIDFVKRKIQHILVFVYLFYMII